MERRSEEQISRVNRSTLNLPHIAFKGWLSLVNTWSMVLTFSLFALLIMLKSRGAAALLAWEITTDWFVSKKSRRLQFWF